MNDSKNNKELKEEEDDSVPDEFADWPYNEDGHIHQDFLNSITASLEAKNRKVNYIGRKPAASPASGYLKKHLAQQKEIIEKVVGR